MIDAMCNYHINVVAGGGAAHFKYLIYCWVAKSVNL